MCNDGRNSNNDNGEDESVQGEEGSPRKPLDDSESHTNPDAFTSGENDLVGAEHWPAANVGPGDQSDELTNAEALREAREASQRMAKLVTPYLNSIQGTLANFSYAKIISDSFNNVGVTQQLLRNAFASFPPQSMPSRSLLDAHRVSASWRSAINRTDTIASLNLPSIHNQWLKQIQIVNRPIQQMLDGFAEQLPLIDFASIRRALQRRTVPGNLAQLGLIDSDLDDVVEVLDDGIPLFWVPRARIARRLLLAESTSARKKVIGDEIPAILDDCRSILEQVTDQRFLYWADCLNEAADLVTSHPKAAQALATTTLDSQLYRIQTELPHAYTVVTSGSNRSKSGHEDKARADLRQTLGPRGALALAAVRPLYVRHQPSAPKAPPKALNKHASFHNVHPFQYSKRNATIAIMLGSSVLLYLSRWFETELRDTN